jgi:hypothetical protein
MANDVVFGKLSQSSKIIFNCRNWESCENNL